MKYAILIMEVPEALEQLSADEREAWSKDVFAWYEKWGASGKLASGGAELEAAQTAKTIRAGGVTDGPFIEAKEVVAGVSVLEAETIDEAVEIGGTWPGVDRGLITIEVRPVVQR